MGVSLRRWSRVWGKNESITRKGERQLSPESAKRMFIVFLQKKAKEDPFTVCAVKSEDKEEKSGLELEAVSDQPHSQAFDFEGLTRLNHDGFVVRVFGAKFNVLRGFDEALDGDVFA